MKNIKNKTIFEITIALMCLVASGLAHAGLFGYSTYGDCILDKMPEVKNDVAARAVMQVCGKYPDQKPSKPWIFGTFEKCVMRKAKDTGGQVGPLQIRNACYKAYKEEKDD